MDNWQKLLKVDPIPVLLGSGDQALQYFVQRDLLGEPVGQVSCLWQLPGAVRILKKQLPDGSWSRNGEEKHPAINYHLIETWRNFRFLVEKYGFTREHHQVEKAAEYLFSCQTDDGDLRGILANQYATYYTGAILSLLIQTGYTDDPRLEKGIQWLLAMRQDDQGWSIPMITYQVDRATQYRLSSQYAEPLEPNRSRPFSHNCTGMVIRAFAQHSRYCHSEATFHAANLLKSRFFQPDAYSSYHAASYWLRFEYPYWWNNLVAALDSISLIGLSRDDRQIAQALQWLVDHQEQNGLWKVSYAKEQSVENAKSKEMKYWITLAVCRIFKRFYST